MNLLFVDCCFSPSDFNLSLLIFQLVQPAFQSVLGHLRSGALDKFKDAFDKALNGGEAFSSAAQTCSQCYMTMFDERCAGMVFLGKK